MTTIDYSSGSRVVNELPHGVYTKAVWTDEWTLQPNMSCHECLWTAAPNVNTARLRWEIGNVVLPGDTEPTTIGVWVGRGQFVKIDWLCDDGTTILRWVGYIDSTSRPSELFGFQEIVAYGLERALSLTTISRSVWWDEGAEEPKASPVALPFNGPNGIRSDSAHTIGDNEVYLFKDTRSLQFMLETAASPIQWSTREIVRYLLTQMLPTSNLGVTVIPWTIVGIDLLPDWDSPRVDTEYRTVWDVLNELVNAKRLLGFTCGNDGSEAVTIKFFTHLASDLTISDNTIPANPTQHTLITQPDALTSAFYADISGGYDQVICRGARKQVICTLQLDEADSYTINLKKFWKPADQTDYDKGASEEAGYGALSNSDKNHANARVRRSSKLQNVYRAFYVDGQPFFDNDGSLPTKVLSRIPIKKGYNWDGAVSTTWFDRDGEGIEPFISWPLPGSSDTAARVASNNLAGMPRASKRAFSVRLSTSGRLVFIDAVGAEQHVLAKGVFTPLPVDDASFPIIEGLKVRVTTCIELDRHIEGVYPSTAPTANIVRRYVVDAGPEYHHVEVLSDLYFRTVTGIDSESHELTSNGGILVDDSDKLSAIARFIAQSYALTRQSVSWKSQRKIGGISVGDLITTSDGATINSPVMAININGGVSINRPAPATMQSFETYRGGSDPHSLIVSMKAHKNPSKSLPQRIPVTAMQIALSGSSTS